MTDPPRAAAGDSQRALATFALHRSSGKGAWVEATGTSMQPGIRPGDRLYVDFGARRARLGEIVVFPDGGQVVAHRLVRRKRSSQGETLLTRGDATLHFDRPFPADRAFGVVRACRRGEDGAFTPIVNHGPQAVVVAGVSAAAGYLLVTVERLPGALRRPLGVAVRRLAPAVIARSVRACAWSTRAFGSSRPAAGVDAAGFGEAIGPSFPTLD